MWLPKGATVRRLLEEYILEIERKAGYQHVFTPDIAAITVAAITSVFSVNSAPELLSIAATAGCRSTSRLAASLLRKVSIWPLHAF